MSTESSTSSGGADRAPALLSPVGLHGMVAAFDPAVEQWDEYTERLQHYFMANDIVAEAKQRAIFLNAVGPTTYRLIKTLASPSESHRPLIC